MSNLILMKNIAHRLAAIVIISSLTGGGAAAAGPASPALLMSDPEDGVVLATAPAEVSLTFSQPLDAHYSRVEVYVCGKRVDSSNATVAVSEISAPLKKKFAGNYKVYYFANGTPKGATGETMGTLTFKVKKGPACR